MRLQHITLFSIQVLYNGYYYIYITQNIMH